MIRPKHTYSISSLTEWYSEPSSPNNESSQKKLSHVSKQDVHQFPKIHLPLDDRSGCGSTLASARDRYDLDFCRIVRSPKLETSGYEELGNTPSCSSQSPPKYYDLLSPQASSKYFSINRQCDIAAGTGLLPYFTIPSNFRKKSKEKTIVRSMTLTNVQQLQYGNERKFSRRWSVPVINTDRTQIVCYGNGIAANLKENCIDIPKEKPRRACSKNSLRVALPSLGRMERAESDHGNSNTIGQATTVYDITCGDSEFGEPESESVRNILSEADDDEEDDDDDLPYYGTDTSPCLITLINSIEALSARVQALENREEKRRKEEKRQKVIKELAPTIIENEPSSSSSISVSTPSGDNSDWWFNFVAIIFMANVTALALIRERL